MVKRGKRSSDLTNGLGPDQIYIERLSTEMPILMFPTDSKGNLRPTITVEEIQKEFKNARD